MKKTLLFTFLFFSFRAYSQNVGINATGANPDNSAMLDVQSSSKGFLIPRISLANLTDATTISNPATSLLIYNTNAALSGGTGFYYNNGTSGSPQWTKLATGLDVLWREQTNYVELIPNKALYLQNNIGIGISSPLERLHVADGNIKIGNGVWTSGNDRQLKFGDNEYVRIGEVGEDDAMQLHAKYFIFKPSGSYTGNVGIGTTAAPTAKLEVNGSFKLTNGTQGSGKLLTSDANGTASWSSPVGTTAFRGRNFSSQSLPKTGYTQLTTTLEDYDPNLNFFSSAFTAPATGAYHFDAKVDVSISNTNNVDYGALYILLYKNGVEVERNMHRVSDNAVNYNQTLTINTNLFLAAGDVITLYYAASTSSGSGPATGDNIIFSGFRIY